MKILVIQQKMIGDVLTSSILFEALKKKYPQSELHYLIYPNTFPVVKNNPFIDKIIFYKKNELAFFKFPGFLYSLKKQNYDVVIDVYSKLGSAAITLFSFAPKRISFYKWYTRICYNYVFSRKIEPETNAGQAVEKRMRLLTPLSLDFPKEIKPKIFLTSEEKGEARLFLKKYNLDPEKPLAMISVLGSSTQKTYPLKYLANLLDFIVEKSNANLLLNYIPSQQKEARQVFELTKPATQQHIFPDIFSKDLAGFLALTNNCQALIGNEGGAINMAKALNVPTFAIFSPSQEKSTWNIYEDGISNVSVHLKDYSPEKFQNKPKKIPHAENIHLYEVFKPKFIYPELDKFIKRNLK